MSGHSHWAGIKRQKETTDKKRGVVFAKLLNAITAASRAEPDPNFNPRLRTAIDKARASMVPADNTARAIKRASEAGLALEELVFEAYGPGGTALFIEVMTDSKNRAVAEIKRVLSDHLGKWAEPGSVRWAFATSDSGSDKRWHAKFPQSISADDRTKLNELIEALEDHDNVQEVYTNATST